MHAAALQTVFIAGDRPLLSEPVRVAIVATSAITLRSFLLPYAEHFRRRGWQVHGIASGVGDCARCLHAFDQVHDVRLSRNPLDLVAAALAARELRAIFERNHFDIVHVHTPVAAFLTRFVLRRRRPSHLRVVYTVHGFHFHEHGRAPSNALFGYLERVAGRWTDRMIVINGDDEEAAVRLGLLPREQIRHLPGIGIDVEQYSAPPGAWPYPIPNRGPGPPRVFLCIAEFNPGKRHADVIRAFATLARADVHLALAGTGPLEGDIKALAASLGVEDRVHFLGFRLDVANLLAHCAGLVLCSRREGLPRSVMEAMAAARPVIGSRVRGIRDLLDGGAGLLVPVGDVDAIAAAMRRVLDDPDGLTAMTRLARSRVERYSLPTLMALHDELYDQLLSEPVAAT